MYPVAMSTLFRGQSQSLQRPVIPQIGEVRLPNEHHGRHTPLRINSYPHRNSRDIVDIC